MAMEKSKGSNTFHSSVVSWFSCMYSFFREYNPLNALGSTFCIKFFWRYKYSKELNPWKVLASSFWMRFSCRLSFSVLFNVLNWKGFSPFNNNNIIIIIVFILSFQIHSKHVCCSLKLTMCTKEWVWGLEIKSVPLGDNPVPILVWLSDF